ncbi:indolepyruvate ferredoxin oxidoreductase family protein [Actinomadura sp. KC216]|uniref:indolepyruvate ferredoxin oxidoreductase family protein n=1 Tax=Actinomadura sp. KC216 TaxID=2530370 RepID=UPI00104ED964|nr:indolepyruvate ferredoxin oxidoreductase family protein [Actinomadura sp. KC216]TDB85438.1 indolepyruvate ferredoxin oxidoreductase family protein [Actinomadura sp. KC216]
MSITASPIRDRLELERGRIAIGGVHALVRLLLEQRRADVRRGWTTAGFVSGYRGSPLGGLDQQLARDARLLEGNDIRFVPGVNEELAATAVYGSQLVEHLPGPRYEGVFGLWYGKAPGVDRSLDAFKHGNWLGTSERGGVLAVVGDDPSCKSSTLPSATEGALAEAFMPVLVPASVGDVLRLGRHGFEMSRFSGAWTGFKVVTDVADSHEIVDVEPVPDPVLPEFRWQGRLWRPTRRPGVDLKDTTSLEGEVLEGRLRAAAAYVAANGLDRVEGAGSDAALGLVAAGRTYLELREALDRLGLDDAALARRGVRLLRLAMVYPLDAGRVREFARGLREIVVVEEKRAFVETQIRDVLYGAAERPAVYGKSGPDGAGLVPVDGGLDADRLTKALARFLADRVGEEHVDLRDAVLRPRKPVVNLLGAARTPFFCSGCPHNRSTVVPDGSIAASGIGCHVMTVFADRSIGTTQMGGEGVMWVGAAPFSDTGHMFQNLGDGTFFHSGSLAIRQAVAAGTNITFKILYNAAVAMTGGQDADGGSDPAAITRMLHAEGVAKIVVVADDPSRYPRGTDWAAGVRVRHRDELDAVQRELREVPGVTVLLYDQACAAETRRKRKRGLVPDPQTRVLINEAVCEGCGDCGVKSNCLSVEPVETEFGRKTQINQTSCNKDYSCVDGDCPSFVTVTPGERKRKAGAALPEIGALAEPDVRPESADVLLVGIGGTGVVTVNQVLAMAALLDGRHARALDQTGLSQKAGAVVSHLRIGDVHRDRPGMVGAGGADAYLVFDTLAGTSEPNLRRCAPGRTAAIVSTSEVPTGRMITDTAASLPPSASLVRRIADRTDADRLVALDALGLAERWFGSTTTANFVVVGAAYQSGLLPLSADAIEEALALNGVQVEANVQAFRAGRRLVLEPGWAAASPEVSSAPAPRPLDGTAPAAMSLVDASGADGELARVLRVRVPDLAAYQNLALAKRYLDAVMRVAAVAERASGAEGPRLAVAVARNLYKLMAYKDEYEVARLHLDPELGRQVEERFGAGASVRYMLHPPLLRAIGVDRKIALGRTARPAFHALRAMRRLRGTPFDPFGMTAQRRAERRLVTGYVAVVNELVAGLEGGAGQARLDLAVQIAELPDMVRGYEDVKTANIVRYEERLRELLTAWRSESAAAVA